MAEKTKSNLVVMYERAIFSKLGAKVSSIQNPKIPSSGEIKPEKKIDLTQLESDFMKIVVEPFSTILGKQSLWGNIMVIPTQSMTALFAKANEPVPIVLDSSDKLLKSTMDVIDTPKQIDLLKSPIDTTKNPASVDLLKSPMDVPGLQKTTNLLNSPIDVPDNFRTGDLLKSPIDVTRNPKTVDLSTSPIAVIHSAKQESILLTFDKSGKEPSQVNFFADINAKGFTIDGSALFSEFKNDTKVLGIVKRGQEPQSMFNTDRSVLQAGDWFDREHNYSIGFQTYYHSPSDQAPRKFSNIMTLDKGLLGYSPITIDATLFKDISNIEIPQYQYPFTTRAYMQPASLINVGDRPEGRQPSEIYIKKTMTGKAQIGYFGGSFGANDGSATYYGVSVQGYRATGEDPWYWSRIRESAYRVSGDKVTGGMSGINQNQGNIDSFTPYVKNKTSEFYVLHNGATEVNQIGNTEGNQILNSVPAKTTDGKSAALPNQGLYITGGPPDKTLYAFDLDSRIGVLNEYRNWWATFDGIPLSTLFKGTQRLPSIKVLDVASVVPYSKFSTSNLFSTNFTTLTQVEKLKSIATPIIPVDSLKTEPIGFGRYNPGVTAGKFTDEALGALVSTAVSLKDAAADIVVTAAEKAQYTTLASAVGIDRNIILSAGTLEGSYPLQILAGPIFQKIKGLPGETVPAMSSTSTLGSDLIPKQLLNTVKSGISSLIATVANNLIGKTVVTSDKLLMINQILTGTKYTAAKIFADPLAKTYNQYYNQIPGDFAYNRYDYDDGTKYTLDTTLDNTRTVRTSQLLRTVEEFYSELKEKSTFTPIVGGSSPSEGAPSTTLSDSPTLTAISVQQTSGKQSNTSAVESVQERSATPTSIQTNVISPLKPLPFPARVPVIPDPINSVNALTSKLDIQQAIQQSVVGNVVSKVGMLNVSSPLFKNIGNANSAKINYSNLKDQGSKNNLIQFNAASPIGPVLGEESIENYLNAGRPYTNPEFPTRFNKAPDSNMEGEDVTDKYSDRLSDALDNTDSAGNRVGYTLGERGFQSIASDFVDMKNAMDMILRSPTPVASGSPAGTTEFVDMDLIDFYFEDISSKPTGNKNILIPFRAIIASYNDNSTSNWQDIRYLGRPDPFFIYQGFLRTVDMQFDIAVESRAELLPTWRKLNYLSGMCLPVKYPEQVAMTPPIIAITVGTILQGVPAILNSFSFNLDGNTIWELERNYQLPTYIKVTTDFTILYSDIPIAKGKRFAHRQDWISPQFYQTDDNITVNNAPQKFVSTKMLNYDNATGALKVQNK